MAKTDMTETTVRSFKLSRGPLADPPEAPIQRQELVVSPGSWVGVARTRAGLASSWHHHSDNDTYGYVISGWIRIEFGPGGKESVAIGPGEAFHVPAGIIHREVTAEKEPGVIFLIRVGAGEPVVNVRDPE